MRRVRVSDLSLSIEPDGRVVARATSHGVGARLPPIAVGVLAFCSEPRTAEEVAHTFGPAGSQLWEGLSDAGLLVDPELASATPLFFQNFAHVDVHRRMLEDSVRLNAYARALAAVAPDRVVLDAGTGTGILACLAARAGARQVFAVDAAEIVEVAREVVRRSGLRDRVRVVHADLAQVSVEASVDVVVTETFGALALAEGAARDVDACCARNLGPDGVVIPSAIELWFAPVGDRAVHEHVVAPFRHPEVDLSPLSELALRRAITLDVPAAALLHAGERLACIPFPAGGATVEGEVVFPTARGGVWYGLVGWFVLHLTDAIALPTGPADPSTHWKQVFLPISPVEIAPEDVIGVAVSIRPAPDDRRALEVDWSWQIGDRAGRATHRVR